MRGVEGVSPTAYTWEATGNRLANTAVSTCAMVVLTLRHKPCEERDWPYLPGMEPPTRLRVEYSVRAGSWEGAFVPKHKSIPDDSALYELIDASVLEGSPEGAVASEEHWSTLGLGTTAVEAMRLATGDGPIKILAWLVPT